LNESLTDRVLGSNIGKEVEFRDHETGKLLATAASMDAASLIFGKSLLLLFL
jgi:hypothetical protein